MKSKIFLMRITACVITTLLIMLLANKSFSQKGAYAGLSFTVESSGNGFQPGTGVVFERQATKHSGIETGLYYHNYVFSGDIIYTDSTGSRFFPFTLSERHLTIPGLYKFYSRIVNVSAGPAFDFYTGWKQRAKSPGVTVNNYTIDPAFKVGFFAKVSKRIKLSDDFLLEPEIRINPVFNSSRYYAGFGIAGKYKL